MRKIITIIALVLFVASMKAQAPQKMSYQAVIRNASNALVANANVRMRISVLQGTANGTAVYVETQAATTNANGLATVEIGAGNVVSGTFASIAWGTNSYFIKTETDPTGGTNYTIVGTSQFLSVPYALFASNSGSSSYWTAFGDNIRNNNIGSVGIGTGTDVPFSKLTVRADSNGITQENSAGTTRVGFFTGAVSAWIQTLTNSDLNFATNDNNTPQMTLQKGTGNVGIGLVAPTEKLDVAGKTKTTNLQVTNGAGAGKVLTSDATGNATWQTAGSGSGLTHYVGELFGGGIVASVWKVGGVEHGLIVSAVNLQNPANGGNGIAWSNVSTTLVGAASNTDGLANTNAIIAQSGHTVSAASVCRAYAGGGFNDWYLPSITELDECRKNLFIINTVAGAGAFYAVTFWSSTESFNGSYAMSQNFNLTDNINQSSFKTDTFGIRAVRKF